MICWNCKKEISDRANFCTYCAAKVERAAVPAAKFCTECGRAIAAEARFCTHCGAKAEMHAPAPAAAPVIPAAELEPIAPDPAAEPAVAPEPAAASEIIAPDVPEAAVSTEPEPIAQEFIAALASMDAAAPAASAAEPAPPVAAEPAAQEPASAPVMPPPPSAGRKKRKGLVAVWIAAAAVLVAAGIAVGIWVIRPMLDQEDDRADTRLPSASDTQLAHDLLPEDPASAETPEPPDAPASAEPESPEKSAASQLPDQTQKPKKSEKSEEPAELPEPEPEPIPEPSPVLKIDPAIMDSYMAGRAAGAVWAFAVMDVADGEMVGSARMNDALSSSALLDIPILYAVAAMHEDGTLALDAPVRISRVTAGRTVLSNRVGQTLPLQDLLCYMLQYSDNTASNALMEYLTFQTINEVCNGRGYGSVSLNNYILSTTDYTQNDNYVSCADLCGMLRELYSDQFAGIGGEFLRQNMLIQDSAAASGIGKVAPAGGSFMNLNGQKSDKYNEVAIVDDGTNAYIVAFMASHVSMDHLTAAAQTCGEYVFGTLELK